MIRGSETVLSGGSAGFTFISSGGIETVSSGGTTSGDVVSSGGIEIIDSGATAATSPSIAADC